VTTSVTIIIIELVVGDELVAAGWRRVHPTSFHPLHSPQQPPQPPAAGGAAVAPLNLQDPCAESNLDFCHRLIGGGGGRLVPVVGRHESLQAVSGTAPSRWQTLLHPGGGDRWARVTAPTHCAWLTASGVGKTWRSSRASRRALWYHWWR